MTHLRFKDTHKMNMKGWKNIFYANRKKRKLG